MASFEKELGRWSLQETGGLAKLLASDYISRLSPVKSISSIDHLLQFPSKADSAYSSFSGGSTLPDYHTSPVYNANYCLPPSQLSYMDSEYVRAIYNPSVINSDLGDTYPLKPVDINTLNSSENIYNANVGGQSGGSFFLDSACKSPSPLPPPLPPLPYPPSPPTRYESYKALQTFDKPKDSSNMGPSINQRKPQTPPGSSTNSFSYTCDSKGSHLEDSWKSRLKTESRDLEYSETKNNSPSFTKQPSFVLKESLQSVSSSKTQTVACVPNAVPEYRTPIQANSKASHPPRSNHNVNDLPESKHYFYLANFHKQTFSSTDRSGMNSDSKEQEGKFPMNLHHSLSEEPSERDENVPEGIIGLQYTRHALQKEPMTADRIGGRETIEHNHTKRLGNNFQYCRLEEEKHMDFQDLSKNTAFRPCDPSQIGNSDYMEASFSHRNEMESTGKRLSGKSNPIFYCGPKAEPSLRSSSAFKSENQTNDSCPKNEADAESNKTQLDSHMSKSHPLFDLTSEKITKEKTPMLFHLASGRHAQIAAMFNLKNQTPQEEEAVKVPKRTSQGIHVSTTEGRDPKRESKPPLNAKARPQFSDDHFSDRHGDEPIPGSPGTSADDSCMNDYREKLKIAQKKVLRETSFKRRDLQMSLPIRLKVNPSKRPSIEHFKSLSLTHDHENVESTPLDETLANGDKSKNEEPKKPLVSRIGGRKRQTKEDKKLYHSEPEKLDQMGVVQDPRSLRKGDSTGMVSSEAAEVSLVTSRKMAFENRERARSASNLSKTELKQIQHSALLQYIERKTGQRSTSTQHIPSYKPPPTASSGRRHSEWISYSSTQTITPPEGSSKPPALQKSPESSGQHSSTYGASEIRTERLSGSFSGSEATASKSQLLVREVDSSHTNPSSSMEHHHHAEEPLLAESRGRIKSAPSFQITPRSCAYAQFSLNCDANINTAGPPVALTEGIDRIRPGRESVSSSRGRGKSMEEIGTTEIVHLAVLSQSSDQLFQSQGLDTSPVRSPQRNEPAPADKLQLNLRPSPEKESESLSRQTHLEEDILGLRGGNSRTSAFQRYSRTVQSKEEFPSADGSPAFSLPVSNRSQPSEERPGSPGQILPSRSPVEEDEVFFKDSPGSTKADLQSSRLHANAVELSPRREEPSLLSLKRLSCRVPSEDDEETATEHTYSTPLPQDDVHLDVTTEVSPRMHSDDCANVEFTESKTNALLSEDVSGDNAEERLVTDVDNTSLSNLQPPVGTADHAYSQGNKICCDSISSVQSESNGNGTNCEMAQEVSETVIQDLAAVERTKDLLPLKLKSPEDQRCELLVQEIIAKDQSLTDILDPDPLRKTAVDLMEGLFPVDMSLLDRSRRKKAINRESTEDPTEISPRPIHPLTKYQVQHPNSEPQKVIDDLTSKKVELAANIQAKLQHLRNERELLLSDVEQNCSQGTELEVVLKQVCKPNEYDRYMMFIGDLEKVVSLLLCLSMRLARVENARSKVHEGTDAEERHSLNERHNLLSRQREDAKDLKENLDRREKVVLGILSKYLSEQQLLDYRLFVKLKTSLLVEQKDLDEKIRFHEEQLERLQDSIPT